MTIEQVSLKVRAGNSYELRHTRVITDRFSQLYEVSPRGRAVYRNQACCDLRDEYAARSFIDRLAVEPHAWPHLLHDFGIHLELKVNDFRAGLIHAITLGSVAFRPLPRLERKLGIPGKKALHYCFIAGPVPLPTRNDARHEDIFTQVQAQMLLNTLNLSEAPWRQLFRHAGQAEAAEGMTPDQFGLLLQQRLATGMMLAYAVQSLSEGNTQSIAQMMAAAREVASSPSKNPTKPAKTAPSIAKPGPIEDTPSKTDYSDRKGVQPKSLSDARQRLERVRAEIAANGVQRKYSSAEVQAMVHNGALTKERFHVRMMEARYVTFGGGPGLLGAPLKTASGFGAKYWSTTFDQAEDNDSLAELYCSSLGIPYDPDKAYALAIIDTEKAIPLTGVKSIVPEFSQLSRFANEELPKEFPESVTAVTMTPEFQKQYAEHHGQAVKQGFLENAGDSDTGKFKDYLKQTNLSVRTKDALEDRFIMHHTLGNNAEFEGNGLTKQMHPKSSKYTDPELKRPYGVVETFNVERKLTNLDELIAADAVTVIRLG